MVIFFDFFNWLFVNLVLLGYFLRLLVFLLGLVYPSLLWTLSLLLCLHRVLGGVFFWFFFQHFVLGLPEGSWLSFIFCVVFGLLFFKVALRVLTLRILLRGAVKILVACVLVRFERAGIFFFELIVVILIQ